MENIWLLCPCCRGKTRTQVRKDSILEHFPLFCPKCKQEFIVTVRDGIIINIEKPDAKAQSR